MFLSQPGSPAAKNISTVASTLLSQLTSGGPNVGLKIDSSLARSVNVPGCSANYQPKGAKTSAATPPAAAPRCTSASRFGEAASAASHARPITPTKNLPGV